jgi:hypothetical protein
MTDARRRFAAAIEPLPNLSGGKIVVVMAGGPPAAATLLSTGNLALDGNTLRVALHASGSITRSIAGDCLVLVDDRDCALRALVSPIQVRQAGPLEVVAGPIAEIRPTCEPPWKMLLRFDREDERDAAIAHVAFWASLRSWLEAGARGQPPDPPCG